ncbi:MAG: ABC transporter family substrate-binding protein [Galactobacter sp.]|uniref:ABC transporter family substrate-binding protein n=1 Tax=Galactobacter sp. TaxID=2676125 RepID=UPI0025B93059|nr:ABC transporter family substrate-binding protein [Galactobacter sp.]
MRRKRVSAAVAIGAAAALALAACSPGGSNDKKDSKSDSSSSSAAGADGAKQIDGDGRFDLGDVKTQEGKEIKVSVGSTEFGGFNAMTPLTYDTYSSSVFGQYMSGWAYFGTDGKIHPNEELGTYKKVSDDPLTIEYTISDDAKWSDGTPITVADAVLSWGSQNAALVGEDGETPVFNNVSTDLVELAPKGPEGDANGKKFSITYTDPNPDWELQTLLDFPAHVVAKQSGMSVDDLVDALRKQDAKKLAKAGDFWSNGWNPGKGKLPAEDTLVTSGPYVPESWDKGQSITLKANPNYFGAKAGVEKLVFRFVDNGAMVQGLQNGDLDVMAPQPTVDTVKQLEALGDQATIHTGDTLTWEHVDFNFAGTSVFKDSADLRKAFALCIPRQQIVDNLIKPLNEDAEVLNTRDTLPGQEGYEEILKDTYNGEYDEVDIEKSKELIKKAGKSGKVTVRLGFNGPNPRRSDEVQLIKASCDKAGFDVKDVSSEDFGQPGGPVEKNDYDAYLFAWAGSGQIASGANIYGNGQPQNFGKYESDTVNAAFNKIKRTLDMDEHIKQEKIAEKALWDDMFGIPIFLHPGVDASSSKIENVKHTMTQDGITWNAFQWQIAE